MVRASLVSSGPESRAYEVRQRSRTGEFPRERSRLDLPAHLFLDVLNARAERQNRRARLASRAAHTAAVRTVLAAARRHGRPRHDDDARAGRHRVLRGIRHTWYQW